MPCRTAKRKHVLQEDVKAEPDAQPEGGPVTPNRNPTTSCLTATTLIYAIGAGITVTISTKLALQLILTKGFKFYSFQLQDMDALYCYFLSLPPCVRIGHFVCPHCFSQMDHRLLIILTNAHFMWA